MSFISAWLLVVICGACVYRAFAPMRGDGWRSATFGYGTLIGLLLTALAVNVSARTHTAHAWLYAAPLLTLIACAALAVTWRRRRYATPALAHADAREPRWQRGLLGFLLALLIARGVVALREIWLRPTYPWDAWSAWAVRAKTWFLLGDHVPFVSLRDWLQQAPPGAAHTSVAWAYPNTLGWIDVYFASAAGGWIEPLINLSWFALWCAMLLAHYGQWRALGLTRTRALFCIYLLGSLPLLTVHVALAGYADLWVAVVYSLAMLAWMRWLQYRDTAQLVLAIVLALALPLLKFEGAIWCALLLMMYAFGTLSQRWRVRAAVVVGIAAAAVIFGLPAWLFAQLGWIDAHGTVVDQRLGPFALLLRLSWHGEALSGVADALFFTPNWHLLWWIVPVVIAWRWRELVARDELRLPALLLLASVGALALLFFGTAAAAWAQSFTATNRLVLQIVPAVVTLLAMLIRDAALPVITNGTDRESAAHSAQA